MLRELIAKHDVDCWLVNTGWTGGIYGTGRRMPIKVTRALLTAALDGSLRNVEFRTDQYFGFAVPTALPGVPSAILDPVKTWADKAEFDITARKLVGHVPEELRQVRSAGRRRSPRRGAGRQARGGVRRRFGGPSFRGARQREPGISRCARQPPDSGSLRYAERPE